MDLQELLATTPRKAKQIKMLSTHAEQAAQQSWSMDHTNVAHLQEQQTRLLLGGAVIANSLMPKLTLSLYVLKKMVSVVQLF